MGYFLIAMLVVSSYLDSSAARYYSRDDPNAPWKSKTLPRDIEAIRYDLRISPDFYGNDSYFNGYALIHMKAHSRTNLIIIHSKQLRITAYTVRDQASTPIRGTTYFPYEENDYLVFQTVVSLPARFKLELSFTGNILTTVGDHPVNLSGLYKIPYINTLNGKQSWVLVTDFRPGSSRYAFPNFDDPRFKTRYNITIRHRKEFTALLNTPLLSRISDTRHWDETMFKLSPRMNSHLVCLTISEFGFKNTTIDETEYRIWARPDRLDEVDYALNLTTTIQQYLFQELGKPHLLEKLDQFAVPGDLVHDKSESWGLATYKESRLLFSGTQEVDDDQGKALNLVARTMTHHYFEEDFSASPSKDHVWLKEGLTIFYAFRAVRTVDPSYFNKELYYDKGKALTVDGTNKSRALVELSDSPSKSSSTRGEKGAAILHMIESFVGADNFRRAMRRFLKEYANRTIVTRHLFNELQQEVGQSLDIKSIMQDWVFETGIPVIQVELLPGNVINATQKQFLAIPSVVRSRTDKWYVPLSYRTGAGNNGLVWMNKTDVVFDVPLTSSHDWIVFNPERSGYYRVNYDAILWNRITEQLNENHTVFTELTRSTLLNDAYKLARADQLGFDTFLNLTKYAFEERDLTPWIPIKDGFHEIREGIFHTTIASRFESYVLNLTSKLMDEFLVKKAVSNHEKQLRQTITSLACSSGHKRCMELWTRAFQVWIQNRTHVVPENTRSSIYCNAMALSVDESDWNTTFERFMLATSNTEIDQLLHILSCSRNLTILEWLLDFSISKAATDRDPEYFVTIAIMAKVARNPSAEGLCWNWLKRNYAKVDQAQFDGFAGKLVWIAALDFKTQAQYQELLDFYTVYTAVPKWTQDGLMRIINRKIRWMDRHFNTIVSWLEQDASAQ